MKSSLRVSAVETNNQLLRWMVIVCLTLAGFLRSLGQNLVTGLEDREVYRESVTFQVQPLAGHDSAATLNGTAVTIGAPIVVDRPNYYELTVARQNIQTGAVAKQLIRFIVTAIERGSSEWGLPQWNPDASIPSSDEEFEGSELRLLMPTTFPAGYPVPVIAWVKRSDGLTVRASGTLKADGHPDIEIRRGVGSGFLSSKLSGTISLVINGITARRELVVEANTIWSNVSGRLISSARWEKNQRVHVTADLEIPEGVELMIESGTVVKLNPGVSIKVDGQVTIEGETTEPVIFMPAEPARPWGGFRLQEDTSKFAARGAIFTGSGEDPEWISRHGFSSHRDEECLFFLENSPTLSLTDCAAIDLAGQFGHAVNGGSVLLTRCLVQRCTTGGEFTGTTFTASDSAFIEFPDATPHFVDGDNDAIYLVSGTLSFTNTLFGWAKDDGIDCGAGGVGSLNLQGCWFESVFHEAMALSGAKTVRVRDSVFLHCGQGLETGYGGPIATAEHCLALDSLTGMRFGDNYDWDYSGYLTVTNSVLLDNYRDVFGHTWNTTGTGYDTNQWVERTGQMDIRGNYLSTSNPYHKENRVWQPASDGWRLGAFLTTPAGAKPGVGIATHSTLVQASELQNGVPIRLSSFATNLARVDLVMESPGAVRSVQQLVFQPGEVHQLAAIDRPFTAGSNTVRLRLENAMGCQVTKHGSVLLIESPSSDLKLEWAHLDEELVLFWQRPGWVLESADELSGPWLRGIEQLNPVPIKLRARQRFFRLVPALSPE